MSEQSKFWFHCGRCGSLFQSEAGADERRACSNCGEDPSTGIMEAQVIVTHVEVPSAAKVIPSGEGPRGKRSVRKRKSNHFMLKLVLGWCSVLAIIVIGARKLYHVEERNDLPPPVSARKVEMVSDDDRMLLDDNVPKCAAAFTGFLMAGVPEQRNQFVLSPVTTASRMALFYSMNPLPDIKPEMLTLTSNSVIEFPEGKAIEVLWSTEDGRRVDVVFREENGEWRMDWDHFARYSDAPWSLFLAGSESSEGEFRLLARERLADERKNADSISLVLYAPRFGRPEEVGFQSPEFLVSRRSRNGQLLDAAFKQAREKKPVFHSNLTSLNPEGMIRVRVRVKRTEVDLERRFEIADVLGCHWYSVEDPGVTLPDPVSEASAETPDQSR